MFVHVNSTPKSPRRSVQVRESRRIGDKVKSVIVRYVGIALNDAEEAKLKQLAEEFIVLEEEARSKQLSLLTTAKNKPGRPKRKTLAEVVPPSEVALTDVIEERRQREGINEVAGYVYEQLGYDSILDKNDDKKLLKDLVLSRFFEPASKHKTQKHLINHSAKTYDLDRIYRLMDKLYERIGDVKTCTFQKTLKLFPNTVDIVFFDVTTLYFESIETDDMRKFGYSKDHRFNTTQVVLALATNQDGLPIGYELFSGNTAEVSTLLLALSSWQKLFDIKNVCFVGDRAMFSEKNLSLLEDSGYQYVVAAKLRTMPQQLKEKLFDDNNYKARVLKEDIAWVGEFEHKDRRLIVSYKSSRALHDKKQRELILEKIKKRIGDEGSTKKLINNHGVKKYTSSNSSTTYIDQNKVDEDSLWDGLHGVITNIRDLDANHILGRYAHLWVIEESFRINKHNLSVRPIYHFKPERIKAHIALCYMAYATLRHLQYQVNLMQKISVDTIIDELRGVQSSIYIHKRTKDRYRVPGAFSQTAAKIYKCFNINRSLDAEVHF
jgi:transposase